MIRIEVKSNQKKNSFKPKVVMQHTSSLEAIFLMAVAYDLIKQNDETGLTEKELFKDVKDMAKELERQRKENK